jgi:hypothetical protein
VYGRQDKSWEQLLSVIQVMPVLLLTGRFLNIQSFSMAFLKT